MGAVSAGVDQLDTTLTAVDFLEREKELIQKAAAAFPNVYSCLSCSAEGRRGGVCYGCMVSCHTRCEIIELGYRTNFRCDCGTPRVREGECELKKGFSEENNANNKYNHNFDGRFCICDEIYNPDLETRTMHQCVVCEDWFHEGCIPHEPTDGVQEGIICRGCLDEAPRLRRYAGNDGFRVELQRAEGGCLVEDLSESEPCEVLFVPENWRQSLCNCEECNSYYASHGIEHLKGGFVIYEPEPEEDPLTPQHSAVLKSLQKLDRFSTMNTICAFNSLKDSLKKYLRKFADSGKVVTDNEVREFFEEYKKKRPRMS